MRNVDTIFNIKKTTELYYINQIFLEDFNVPKKFQPLMDKIKKRLDDEKTLKQYEKRFLKCKKHQDMLFENLDILKNKLLIFTPSISVSDETSYTKYSIDPYSCIINFVQ